MFPLHRDAALREHFSFVPIFPLWSVEIFYKVRDRLRRFIREVPRLCAIWTPQGGGKREGCVSSSAKIKVLFRLGWFLPSDCFSFSCFVVAYRKYSPFLASFLSFLRNLLCFFYFDLESMSPHFLANLARFREKGVRFLTPVA